MTTVLDPRFAKCVALMRGSSHQGERDAARGRATKIAAGLGLSLDEALKLHDGKSAQPAQAPRNWFDGFEDWMEQREPGYKARRAAENIARKTARQQRAAEAIKRYGSKKAALAPCWREQALRKALKPWATMCDPPHQRWTLSLDGWSSPYDVPPDHLKVAAREAYPMPATFREAAEENAYWDNRRREIEDLLDDGTGENLLDLTAALRARMVQDLVETEIRVTDIADLRDRFAIIVEGQSSAPNIQAAIFRDLNAMVEAQTTAPAAPEKQTADLSTPGRIEALLRSDPQASDRSIARQAGCSPTTVGKIRRALGLGDGLRSVHRRGQIYRMNCAPHRASHKAETIR